MILSQSKIIFNYSVIKICTEYNNCVTTAQSAKSSGSGATGSRLWLLYLHDNIADYLKKSNIQKFWCHGICYKTPPKRLGRFGGVWSFLYTFGGLRI